MNLLDHRPLLSMSTCSSVGKAPAQLMRGNGFVSYWGHRIYLCPRHTSRQFWHFDHHIIPIIFPSIKLATLHYLFPNKIINRTSISLKIVTWAVTEKSLVIHSCSFFFSHSARTICNISNIDLINYVIVSVKFNLRVYYNFIYLTKQANLVFLYGHCKSISSFEISIDKLIELVIILFAYLQIK